MNFWKTEQLFKQDNVCRHSKHGNMYLCGGLPANISISVEILFFILQKSQP